MGCDKLKAFRALDIDNDIGDESTGLAYPKAPVDAVIAELKAQRDAFEKSFNEMTEAFMRSQRALWLLFADLQEKKADEIYASNFIIDHWCANVYKSDYERKLLCAKRCRKKAEGYK